MAENQEINPAMWGKQTKPKQNPPTSTNKGNKGNNGKSTTGNKKKKPKPKPADVREILLFVANWIDPVEEFRDCKRISAKLKKAMTDKNASYQTNIILDFLKILLENYNVYKK